MCRHRHTYRTISATLDYMTKYSYDQDDDISDAFLTTQLAY